jgi:hypothetical protein
VFRPRGFPGRNWSRLVTTKGAMNANCISTMGWKAGGVGRHCPIAVPPVNGGKVRVNPSVVRQARTSRATVVPHASPLTVDCPVPSSSSSSLSAATDAALAASHLACWVGKILDSTVYAAPIRAARRDVPGGRRDRSGRGGNGE